MQNKSLQIKETKMMQAYSMVGVDYGSGSQYSALYVPAVIWPEE